MRNDSDRRSLLDRLHRLSPEHTRFWGRMTVRQMIAHLTDQMRHTLGDAPCRPVPSVLRWTPLRYAALYWFPWPKGRIKGPPDAFVTEPSDWDTDVAVLTGLVDRFGARMPEEPWPDHPIFGRMSGADWGYFCYRHFDHHLRQFGE